MFWKYFKSDRNGNSNNLLKITWKFEVEVDEVMNSRGLTHEDYLEKKQN